ncbi:hypothetical protein Gpo141_00013878 [Globisporangium polare]
MEKSTSDSSTSSTHVTAPVFTPLCPPRIESISHEALVKWKCERLAYEEMVNVRCAGTLEKPSSVSVSVKSTMNQQLLNTCCRLKWKIPVEKIDDRRLLTELNAIINSVRNNSRPDIDNLIRTSLRMNLKEGDVTARIVDFFNDCEKLVSTHGLSKFFTGDAGEKEKYALLVRSITPVELRETILDHQRFEDQSS